MKEIFINLNERRKKEWLAFTFSIQVAPIRFHQAKMIIIVIYAVEPLIGKTLRSKWSAKTVMLTDSALSGKSILTN